MLNKFETGRFKQLMKYAHICKGNTLETQKRPQKTQTMKHRQQRQCSEARERDLVFSKIP